MFVPILPFVFLHIVMSEEDLRPDLNEWQFAPMREP
jgi:hypothetical protein